MTKKVPQMIGGRTVPVSQLTGPKCATCGVRVFFRGERFDHSNEVRIIAICQGCDFDEEARIFNGGAWDSRGPELVRESYAAFPPFGKRKFADGSPVESKASVDEKPAAPTAWWRRVDKLETGDIITGPIPDLAGPQRINPGQKIVIVSVTQGMRDVRVRYRTVGDDERYGTFVAAGSMTCQIIGNEYLPNEALKAGAVDILQINDGVIVSFDHGGGKVSSHEGIVAHAKYTEEGWTYIVYLTKGMTKVTITDKDIASRRCVRA